MLRQSIWTPIETFGLKNGTNWSANYNTQGQESYFDVYREDIKIGGTAWNLFGKHNLANALAALSAAAHAGVSIEIGLEALSLFEGVKRRLEKNGVYGGITLYDDFAHHPTAITATLDALRRKHPQQCLIVVLEARSNTMKLGHHLGQLGQALSAADRVIIWRRPDLIWDPAELAIPNNRTTLEVCNSVEAILELLRTTINPRDQIVLMSNGDFDGLATRLINQLRTAN